MAENDFGARRGPTKLLFPAGSTVKPRGAFPPPPPPTNAESFHALPEFSVPSSQYRNNLSLTSLSNEGAFPETSFAATARVPGSNTRASFSMQPFPDVQSLHRSISFELDAPSFGQRRRLSSDDTDANNMNRALGSTRPATRPPITVVTALDMIPEDLRKPTDDPRTLEMRVSEGLLVPPPALQPRQPVNVVADPFGSKGPLAVGQTFVRDPNPATPEVHRPVYRQVPPPLLPSAVPLFLEVDEDGGTTGTTAAREGLVGVAAPTLEERQRRRAAMASLTETIQGPAVRGDYVPFAVRQLGHDDVKWVPPDLEGARRQALDNAFPVPTSVAVEVPVPPPSSIRNVVETYRTKRKLVAFDESEAFAFCARPVHAWENIERLREETRRAQADGRLSSKASVVTLRHGTSVYIIGGDRRFMVSFNPAVSVEGMPSSGWRWMDLQDGPCGGAYEDHGVETLRRGEIVQTGIDPYTQEPITQTLRVALSIPPAHAPLIPIPNVPYAAVLTRSRVYLLSLEDGVWFSARLADGLNTYQQIGWVHLIDECTLYVRNKTCTLHGAVSLRSLLLDVTVFRRNTHDDFVPALLQTHGEATVPITTFRLTPSPEKLIGLDGVPGVAAQVVKGGTDQDRKLLPHIWLFVFHPKAKNFVPWKRLDDVSSLLYVAMPNHMNDEATTVLFFTEELRRIDTGAKVNRDDGLRDEVEPRSRRAIAASSLTSDYDAVPVGQRAQTIIRVAYRLRVPYPSEAQEQPPTTAHSPPPSAVSSHNSSVSNFSTLIKEGGGGATRERTLLSRVLRGLRPLGPGLTREQFVSSLSVMATSDAPNDIDAILKGRREDLHTVVPMHDRCAAFLSYDCKAYVVMELDRLMWLREALKSNSN